MKYNPPARRVSTAGAGAGAGADIHSPADINRFRPAQRPMVGRWRWETTRTDEGLAAAAAAAVAAAVAEVAEAAVAVAAAAATRIAVGRGAFVRAVADGNPGGSPKRIA
jgi:hypothetical protein